MLTTLSLVTALTVPTSPKQEAPRWAPGDTALGAVSAGVGALLGGLVGGFLGQATAGECTGSDYAPSKGQCFMHGVGETATGALLGSHLGAAGGVSIYGATRGFDGSYWGALGGATVGSLGGGIIAVSLCASDDEALCMSGVLLGVAAHAIGASVGYKLSIDTPAPPAQYGGLVAFDPAHGVRLAVPTGGMTVQEGGEYTLGLTLAAGAF